MVLRTQNSLRSHDFDRPQVEPTPIPAVWAVRERAAPKDNLSVTGRPNLGPHRLISKLLELYLALISKYPKFLLSSDLIADENSLKAPRTIRNSLRWNPSDRRAPRSRFIAS